MTGQTEICWRFQAVDRDTWRQLEDGFAANEWKARLSNGEAVFSLIGYPPCSSRTQLAGRDVIVIVMFTYTDLYTESHRNIYSMNL